MRRAPFRRPRQHEAGFTLVEVMVAAMLLMVGVLGTVSVIRVAAGRTVADQAREAALNLSREILEAAPRAPYATLTAGGAEAALRSASGVGAGTPWRATIRGREFTISVSACAVDDPSDGLGGHGTDTYCAESAAVGTADADPVDARRVRVTVSWPADGATRSIVSGALVPSPGEAEGPEVTNLTFTTAAGPVFTFRATASAGTTRVTYSVGGSPFGNGTLSGGTWDWSWNVSSAGYPAGRYIVEAKAFDAQGRSRPGGARYVTVTK